MFDETALFAAFLRRLSDETEFQLNMCLDEDIFMKGETPKVSGGGAGMAAPSSNHRSRCLDSRSAQLCLRASA